MRIEITLLNVRLLSTTRVDRYFYNSPVGVRTVTTRYKNRRTLHGEEETRDT